MYLLDSDYLAVGRYIDNLHKTFQMPVSRFLNLVQFVGSGEIHLLVIILLNCTVP